MTKHTGLTVLAASLLLLTSGLSQARAEDDFQAKYEKKIAKDFVANGGWLVDYDEARAAAAKDGKLIFVYFTRSYSR